VSLKAEQVTVKIMGREYAFVCEPDEKVSLYECCELVDHKMSLIRAHGKLSAMDRIAVMTALSLAQELISTRHALAQAEVRMQAAVVAAASARAAAPTAMQLSGPAGEIDEVVAEVNDRIERFIASTAQVATTAPLHSNLFGG